MAAHHSGEDIYEVWMRDDRSEKKGLRLSLAVAAVLHGALLLVAIPEYSEVHAAPNDDRAIYVVEPVRFKKPLTPPTPPEPETRRVPMPDPDPLDFDPIVRDDALAPLPELEVDEGVFFSFPEAPPVPEPVERIYQVGEIAAPERVHFVEPRYTDAARKTRTQGIVVLKTTIDKHGDVVDLEVLKSLPMGLTESASRAVRQWKFRPSTVDGRPVAVLYNLTIRFTLN